MTLISLFKQWPQRKTHLAFRTRWMSTAAENSSAIMPTQPATIWTLRKALDTQDLFEGRKAFQSLLSLEKTRKEVVSSLTSEDVTKILSSIVHSRACGLVRNPERDSRLLSQVLELTNTSESPSLELNEESLELLLEWSTKSGQDIGSQFGPVVKSMAHTLFNVGDKDKRRCQIVAACIKSRQFGFVNALLEKMKRVDRKYEHIILGAFLEANQFDRLQERYNKISSFSRPSVLSNCVMLRSFAKQGRLEDFRQLWSNLKRKHPKLSTRNYAAAIQGLTESGLFGEAKGIIQDAKNAQIKRGFEILYAEASLLAISKDWSLFLPVIQELLKASPNQAFLLSKYLPVYISENEKALDHLSALPVNQKATILSMAFRGYALFSESSERLHDIMAISGENMSDLDWSGCALCFARLGEREKAAVVYGSMKDRGLAFSPAYSDDFARSFF